MVAMKGVELFAKGVWRGKPYTESDLDDIVNNFNTHQAPGPNRAMRVALVKYHWPEEIKEGRLPRHGTVTRLYREDGKLCYDAENVDPELAKDIQDDRLADISAEIYDNPPEGITGAKGKMLRRVTFQGAEPPHIKGLNPRGLAQTLRFREVPTIEITRYSNRRGVYETFSERVPVSRDEMIARLVEMGMTVEVLNTLDDVQLQEIVKTAAGQGSATLDSTPSVVKDGQPTGDKTVADENKDGLKDESKEKPVVAKTVTADDDDVGDDKDKAAKKYSEMHASCAKFAEKYKTKFGAAVGVGVFSEGFTGTPGAQGNGGCVGTPATVTFSEDQIKAALADVIADGKAKMAEMYSEGKAQIATELAANQKAIADTKVELKRQRLELFAETELRTGRLEPADLDRGKGPNIIDRWMLLDDAVVVHKFTEDGREKELTALDAELRAVRQKPVKYTPNVEKIHSGMPKPVETFAEGSPAQRKAAFVSFAESQLERFARTDTTPKEIIAAWEVAPTEAARRELERELGFTGA